MRTRIRKYFKPGSLTWWASFVPLAAGITVASASLHGWHAGVETINNLTGNTSPTILINAGLAGIGIRGMNG